MLVLLPTLSVTPLVVGLVPRVLVRLVPSVLVSLVVRLAPLVQPGGRGRCVQGSPGSPPWGERRGAEILAAKTRNWKEIW